MTWDRLGTERQALSKGSELGWRRGSWSWWTVGAWIGVERGPTKSADMGRRMGSRDKTRVRDTVVVVIAV